MKILCRPWKRVTTSPVPVWDLVSLDERIVATIAQTLRDEFAYYDVNVLIGKTFSFEKAREIMEKMMNVKIVDDKLMLMK